MFRDFWYSWFGPEVEVGQVWQMEFDDPFKEPVNVTVLGVRKGWVRYQRHGEAVTDTVLDFRLSFRLADAEEKTEDLQ